MDEPKFPPLNAFYIEDEDAPGEFLIPVVIINNEHVKLNNIRADKLDLFKHIAGTIGAATGQRVYFAEYDTPSYLEVVEKPEQKHHQLNELMTEIVKVIDKSLADAGIDINIKDNEDGLNKKKLH